MSPTRRIAVATAASIAVHVAILAIPRPHRIDSPPAQVAAVPLTVEIVAPEAERPAVLQPQQVPAPRVTPEPAKRLITRAPEPKVERIPVPVPAPPPPTQPPPVDMLAMIEARRAQRRAAEEARSRPTVPMPQVEEDAAARNLSTLKGREGVGGVFQILRMGTRTAEFAFNGWRPEARSQWREVIEVDAGQGGNVELAVVRRMIELIRTHYQGDFNWESHRIGRVVVLSARLEDSAALEDFLLREFFGPQVINPRLRGAPPPSGRGPG